jgi:hypothetical protein
MDQVVSEESPDLLLAPLRALPPSLALPQAWHDLLKLDDAHRQAAKLVWAGTEGKLPQLLGALEKKLQAIGLLITATKKPSLLYIFTKENELFAWRGYLPSEHLISVCGQLSVDLSAIYRVHDGWVDLFSGDTGFLPIEQWRILGQSQVDGVEGFLEIFSAGGNGMGFDLNERPAKPYVVWSDEDVEPIIDFWGRLDSWLSGELDDMDHNTT